MSIRRFFLRGCRSRCVVMAAVCFGWSRVQMPASAADAFEDADRAVLQTRCPALNLDMFERFYREYSPELLEEWRRRGRSGKPGESARYLVELAEHFLKLESVRNEDRVEYERLIRLETAQGRIRYWSAEIRRLASMGEQLLTRETEEERLKNLGIARKNLVQLLERTYEDALTGQAREITRIKEELERLEASLAERRGQREQVVREQYRRLTGQPWSDGK